MSELLDIIISAVDEASDIFQSITGSAEDMVDSITSSTDEGSSDFEDMESAAEAASESIEEVSSAASSIDGSGIEETAMAADNLEQEANEAAEAMQELGSAGDVMAAQTLMDMSSGVANAMMDMANSAGNFEDSVNRASLEAEGFGINADQMKSVVSELSETTGRAGGQIRESFITATARGVTDLNSFKTMMEGAGAQAYLFGTDIQSMANTFSNMALRSRVAEKQLGNTGITVEELGSVLGIQGATLDQVNEKWETMDTNARAAALGQAASMNEGKNANDEYKHSWAGLQEQVDIAKGRLERLAGEVLLPVLIPAMEIASDVLNTLGDGLSAVMSGPLGGLISVLGTAAGVVMISVTAFGALKSILGFLKVEATLAAIETTALAFAEGLQAEGSIASAAANAIGATGFGGLAAAAWGAASAVWAALAPFLPFIAIAAAVVLVIYEVGKAFGWWHDVSSMLSAIGDGLRRLWEAFINHPDVQAALEIISGALQVLWGWIVQAGQAILEFFGVTTGGDFDIVRALIDGIGGAWNNLKTAMLPIIAIVQLIITAFNAFRTGQMDLPGFIMTVLAAIGNAYATAFNKVIGLVANFASQMVQRALSLARNFVNAIVNQVRTLYEKVRSALMRVVSAISGAIHSWISTAKSNVMTLITNIVFPFGGLPSQIAGKLAGVVNAITKPFTDAYNNICKTVDDIKNKVSEISGGLLNFGGEAGPAGGDALDLASGNVFDINSGEIVVNDESNIVVDHNLNITLDLRNVPAHMSEDALIDGITSPKVIKAFVDNKVFQDADSKVKQRLNLKTKRARGA